MGINGDPVVIKVDGSDPIPVTVDGAVTIAEPVEVDGTVAVSSVGGTVAVSGTVGVSGTVPVSVADPVTIAIRTDIDAGNTNNGTLGAGLTWTGTWANLDGLAQVFFNVKSDQAGTYTMQFSSDGITADRTLGPYDLSAGGNAAQPLAAVRGYFRGTFTNTSGSTANLRIETRLLATATPLYVRLSDDFTNASSATATHSVIAGAQANGLVYNNVGISERDALRVELAGPLGGMGGAYTVGLDPRVQVVATYGLVNTDTETFSATGGAVSASAGQFSCTTGVSVGGYGVVRSRRLVRYRAGQGLRLRAEDVTFSPGVALGQQIAGGFTATDGLWFGYSGATFGLTRRIAGATAIHRLTITTGAAALENMTVKLNGVDFVVASGAAILSTTATARKIAEFASGFTGWYSSVSPTSNGATVTFVQATPGATAGLFSFTSTGTAAGSFSTIQAGAANDDTTGFVPQTSWNVDKMDGSRTAENPSGVLLDPSKVQTYDIIYTHGTIRWRIMTPSGLMVVVHRLLYPNSNTTPNQRSPTYRMGIVAASLGSTTNLTTKAGELSAFTEGAREFERDPFSSTVYSFSASTTEHVALALRSRAEFGGTNNQRELVPLTVEVGTETANRTVLVRLVLNPTFSATPDWTYASQTTSSTEVATPAAGTITVSGGQEVGSFVAASGASARVDLRPFDLRMEPGDVLAVCLRASSSTATCTVATIRQEV